MKTCVCDICGKSLPLDNQLDVTILGIALDLCPECSAYAKELTREKQIEIMLIGFKGCRKNNGVREPGILLCGGPSPVTEPREGSGGSGRPPEAGTGGEPSCAGPRKPAQEVSPPVSDPENKPITGPGAALKREVLAKLDVYRTTYGVGCWRTLSEAAGVTEDQIAQVRFRQKVPMETWRSLAKALGVVDPDQI